MGNTVQRLLKCGKTQPTHKFLPDCVAVSFLSKRSGAFALFAKQNYSKNADNDSLKARYDQLADREKLLWIEKAVVASSEVCSKKFVKIIRFH